MAKKTQSRGINELWDRTMEQPIMEIQSELRRMSVTEDPPMNASQRIAAAFLNLLERQFPLDESHPIRLRYASQYANQLNIHVNHLNGAIKKTMNRTTTQVISERILGEAKILLRRRNLSVTDIAYVLGFTEVTHFNNFFKKHMQLSPTKFRVV
jgi:AraC family transcriptional activator of pobA